MNVPGINRSEVRVRHIVGDDSRTFEIDRLGKNSDLTTECLTETIATIFHDPWYLIAGMVMKLAESRKLNSSETKLHKAAAALIDERRNANSAKRAKAAPQQVVS